MGWMKRINLSKSEILAILIGAAIVALSFWLGVMVRVDVEEYSIPIFAFIYLDAILVPALVYRHEKKKLEARKG
mgnify:CR=1 FL=1